MSKRASGNKRTAPKDEQNNLQKSYRDYLPSNMTESGDYFRDCAAGQRLAFNFLNNIGIVGPELSWLVKDLIANRRFGGVEVGFFRIIARSLKQPYVALPTILTHEEGDRLLVAKGNGAKPDDLDLWPDITVNDLLDRDNSTTWLCS